MRAFCAFIAWVTEPIENTHFIIAVVTPLSDRNEKSHTNACALTGYAKKDEWLSGMRGGYYKYNCVKIIEKRKNILYNILYKIKYKIEGNKMTDIYSYISEDMLSNTYLIVDSDSKEAAVVDPSHKPSVFGVEFSGLKIKYILLTHGHFDHIYKAEQYRRDYGAEVCIHKADAELLADAAKNCSSLFMPQPILVSKAEIELDDGASVYLGGTEIRVMHTPGHTLGSVCFLCGDEMFCGDTLFRGSRGRTDFYGGSELEMAHSLQKLKEIKKNYTIYAGHGAASTLDREKKYNNYMLYTRID